MRERYREGVGRLAEKRMDIGLLGKFFGTGENSLKYVICLIALLLTLTIIGVIIFFENKDEAIDLVKIIFPILTLIIGYLAGVIKK